MRRRPVVGAGPEREGPGAPSYSEERAELAPEIGLGGLRRKDLAAPPTTGLCPPQRSGAQHRLFWHRQREVSLFATISSI